MVIVSDQWFKGNPMQAYELTQLFPLRRRKQTPALEFLKVQT